MASSWLRKGAKRTPAKTITDADYARWLGVTGEYGLIKQRHYCIVWNEPQEALVSMSMHTKPEYMCYNQTGNITTLDGASLKLVDKFTYLGSSISSTENDHRHTTNESNGRLSIGSRSYGNWTWPIKWNAVSSRQRLYRYCYIDALLGL